MYGAVLVFPIGVRTMTESTNNQHKHPFEDAKIISSYSRKQAIEDGVLIDLSQWAKETGFVMPVACTSAVWGQYIEPPAELKGLGQDVRGRCHDLLWMLWKVFHKIHYAKVWVM